MKIINSIMVLLLSAIFFSCSSNDPFSSAKEIVGQQVANNSRGYFKLVGMKKMDAVTQDAFGMKVYSLTFSAEVECMKDGGWIYESNGELSGLYSVAIRSEYNEGNTNKQTKIGDKYKFTDQIQLVKHEQGWVEADDGK